MASMASAHPNLRQKEGLVLTCRSGRIHISHPFAIFVFSEILSLEKGRITIFFLPD